VKRTGPQYPIWAETYLNAWSALKFDRSYSHGGMGRVWYASMRSYAQDLGLSGDEFADFITFVSALDEEYLTMVQEQIDNSREGS
jgi:hypothetical protein